MAIELTFLTDDPEEIEIVEQYWALNPNGTFRGTVKSLLPFRRIRKAHGLLLLVQDCATAVCPDNPCNTCGKLSEIKSRSEYKMVLEQPTCRKCSEGETLTWLKAIYERRDAKRRDALVKPDTQGETNV